jgi:hypothetical protein
VGVAAPPVAVTPVNEGIENQVFSQAAGAASVMLAWASVTTPSGQRPLSVIFDQAMTIVLIGVMALRA